jgi:hypothetical protein
MMTPLRHSGRVLWPRVLQGMAAMALACALLVPAAVAAEPAGAPGATIREVTVSKTPYNTTIQASVDGVIENYNSFKLNDPFRIVVDVWGVAQGTAASEIPVGTPQVKAVKISSVDRKLRMVVETPGDRPMPFVVSAEKGVLILSVGGGGEGKVASTERLQDGTAPVKGPAIVGIDLEDLPDASNVVITTAGNPSYQVSKKAGGVTLVFKGAAAEKGLLRPINAKKFDIPVKAISPSGGKNGVTVAVRTPWKNGTVRSSWRSRRVRPKERPPWWRAQRPGVRHPTRRRAWNRRSWVRSRNRRPSKVRRRGDSSPGVPTSTGNTTGSGSPWISRTRT